MGLVSVFHFLESVLIPQLFFLSLRFDLYSNFFLFLLFLKPLFLIIS